VVIDGTTYAIGIGATPTTILVGTETISLGPGGIGLDTTTIAPAPAPAGSTRAADSVGAWCGRPWSGALIGTFLAGIVLIPFWIWDLSGRCLTIDEAHHTDGKRGVQDIDVM
jgi:hypothetical protein